MNCLLRTVTNLKSRTHRVKLFEILVLILLGVLMYVSQAVMSGLPNIEIVSLLIILITRKFGVKAFVAVYVFVFCEIMTYGLSMWVINYLYVWAILCIVIFLVRKIDSAIFYALLSAIYGLLFGTFCSVPYFIIGGISMGVANIIGGIWFDLLHCGGNFILTLLLYRVLTNSLDKALKPLK